MPDRNLQWSDPGPMGNPNARVLFELLNRTNDGHMVFMPNREGLLSGAEQLAAMGYLEHFEPYGKGGFRCDITEKGKGYGRKHFGWREV